MQMSDKKEILELIGKARTWGGWRVEVKDKGWMVYPPDKTKSGVMIHKTPSDWRAWKNVLSELRKRGAPV